MKRHNKEMNDCLPLLDRRENEQPIMVNNSFCNEGREISQYLDTGIIEEE